jgi:hypothetical protein
MASRRSATVAPGFGVAHVFVSALSELQDRIAYQYAQSSEEEQCEVGARA